MAKETMDTLIWNNLYWLIERSYQQTLCCQRYVDRKRKLKRSIDWTLVIIPGIGSLLYFWEPIAAFISAASTTIIGFLNKIAPQLTQQESALNELDSISRKYASIRADAENLVMRFREDDSFGNADVRKVLHKLQKSSDELEVRTNVLLRHISDKENLYLKTETENYLKKYHNE